MAVTKRRKTKATVVPPAMPVEATVAPIEREGRALIELTKSKFCPACEDKRGIPVTIGGQIHWMPREVDPCGFCPLGQLGKLFDTRGKK